MVSSEVAGCRPAECSDWGGQPACLTGGGFTRLQIDFKYDYMGRRIQKSVFNLDPNTVTSVRLLLDDGPNLFAAALKRRTTATNRWLGEALNTAGLHEVNRLVGSQSRQTAPPRSKTPA